MGAWGAETFDNDTACDWTGELAPATDMSVVTETLESVLETGEDYLDSDSACRGLAACEVVARLNGNWGVSNAYTEAVDDWVRTHARTPSLELVNQALAVIDRVLTPPSELLEIWEEVDSSEWRGAVTDLRNRVAGASNASPVRQGT
jgi:hypothetical protein